jgi:hypothetical protein
MVKKKEKEPEVKIITLAWGGWQKRLHFMAPKRKDMEKTFKQIMTKDLNKIGDQAKSWPQFLESAIDVFEKHGFERFKS